jgi:very-short-patch-repair endonuclease
MRKHMTKAEVVLWVQFRSLNTIGYKFRRQHPIGPYIADFVHIKGRLLVELDGATHSTLEEVAYDQRREAYLRARGWTVVRFWNSTVYKDVGWVAFEIARRLPSPDPSLRDGLSSPASGRG